MIYLSQLVLNPALRQVRQDLRTPYEMHRTLSRAFPGDPAAYAEARCLFRVEERAGQPVALVQSRLAPDWATLLANAPDYLLHEPAVKALAFAPAPGQRLAFRLRANPTVKRDGKRHALRQEHEQLAWLQRKGVDHGFILVQVRVRYAARQSQQTHRGQQVCHQGVTFDGLLRVTDPDAFLHALEHGIGAAKGFGFGLLSIARVSS